MITINIAEPGQVEYVPAPDYIPTLLEAGPCMLNEHL